MKFKFTASCVFPEHVYQTGPGAPGSSVYFVKIQNTEVSYFFHLCSQSKLYKFLKSCNVFREYYSRKHYIYDVISELYYDSDRAPIDDAPSYTLTLSVPHAAISLSHYQLLWIRSFLCSHRLPITRSSRST